MRPRSRLLLATAALLGAAIAVLPAVASSETTTVEAITGCSSSYPSYPCWSPSAPITIAAGATVKFVDKSSTLEQGVRWNGTAPTCENVPSANQKGPWEGSCTFTQPGTYHYEGTQIYSTSGEVEVTGQTSTTSTTPTTTSTATSPLAAAPTATSPESGSVNGPSGGAGSSSPLAGSATSAVKVAAVQHGHTVRGSLDVSQEGAGARLEVRLLASRAALARAGSGHQQTVGRVARATLAAGTVSFTVGLDAQAGRALHAHRRLALTVKITIKPASGTALTLARSVLLRS